MAMLQAKSGGSLYLTLPEPKILADAVRSVRGGSWDPESVGDDVWCVRFGAGELNDLIEILSSTLDDNGRRDARVAILEQDEHPGPMTLFRARSLSHTIALRKASWLVSILEERRLFMEYQPIVTASDPNQVMAYECLVRGRDRSGSTIYPGELFAAAEVADLLFPLDREARLTAIRDYRVHGLDVPIFINFLPTAIYDPEYCLRVTVDAISKAGIEPHDVVFEVVESERVTDLPHLLKIVNYYREQGFRIALDDLGSGYASLNMLADLRPDFVKFDMRMMEDLTTDPFRQSVYQKLVELAGDLGIDTITEGVETAEQAQWLREHGANYLQGFYFARPAAPPPKPFG